MITSKNNTRIFILGIIIYLVAQGILVNYPLWTRSLPPEPDDAYVYLSKAPQMEQCFLQGCPALRDLREQVNVKEPYGPAWEAARARIFTLTVYHPLQTVVLIAVHHLGLSWELSYKIAWSAGSLLFLIGIAWLLHALFGPGAAGLGLFLLAFQVFANQGLHYVVPSNLALGIGLIVWARILSKKGKAAWCLLLGSVAMVAMHPVGRIYAIIAILLHLTAGESPWRGRTLLAALGGAAVVAAAFLLPHLIAHPDLIRPAEPIPDGFTYLKYAHDTFRELTGNLYRLFVGVAGLPVFLFTLVAGAWLLPPERKRAVGRMVLILGFFLIISLFYVMPHFPGDVFRRLWIAMAILLTGVCGYGIFAMLRYAGLLLGTGRATPVTEFLGIPTLRLSSRKIGVLLLAVVVAILLQTAHDGTNTLKETIHKVIGRYQYAYNLDQPGLLLSQAREGDKVLYSSLFNLPFYLTHGALDLGAVYYPAVRGTPLEKEWAENEQVRFAVVMNPLNWFQTGHEGKIPLNRYSQVQARFPRLENIAVVRLRIENPTAEAKTLAAVLRSDKGEEVQSPSLSLAPGQTEWLKIPAQGLGWTGALGVTLRGDLKKLFLHGLNMDQSQTLWPWDREAALTFIRDEDGGKSYTVRFKADAGSSARGPSGQRSGGAGRPGRHRVAAHPRRLG